MDTITPKVWIADLAAYNDGVLHGAWIDATVDVDDMYAAIARILANSPVPGGEEHAVFDFEGFGRLRICEYESIENIVRIAKGIEAHGLAFAAWADCLAKEEWDERLDEFDEAYLGHFESIEEYAWGLLSDLGLEDWSMLVPDILRPHVRLDIAGVASDLTSMYSVVEGEDGVYVFTT